MMLQKQWCVPHPTATTAVPHPTGDAGRGICSKLWWEPLWQMGVLLISSSPAAPAGWGWGSYNWPRQHCYGWPPEARGVDLKQKLDGLLHGLGVGTQGVVLRRINLALQARFMNKIAE
jgi:hypothetical protein